MQKNVFESGKYPFSNIFLRRIKISILENPFFICEIINGYRNYIHLIIEYTL